MIYKMTILMLSLYWIMFIREKNRFHYALKLYFSIFLMGNILYELVNNFNEVLNHLWFIFLFVGVSFLMMVLLIYFYPKR